MLLLIFCVLPAASALSVPPPTNVMVSCHSFQVLTRWTYSQQQPQTDFSVGINGSAGHREAQTSNLQYDVSPFVWESERYLGFHTVTVTATRRGQRSEAVKSQTFTYNDLKTAHIKCQLAFPRAVLTVTDSKGLLTFPNPLHVYEELKLKPQLRELSGKVVTDSEEIDGTCTRQQTTCRFDVLLRGNSSCVGLKDWFLTGYSVGKVKFRNTDQICPRVAPEPDPSPPDTYVIVIAVMLSIGSIVVTLVVIAICKVRAWTMRSSPKPKILDPEHVVNSVLIVRPDIFSKMETCSVKMTTSESYRDISDNFDDGYGPNHSAESSCSDLVDPYTNSVLYKNGGLSETSNQKLERTELVVVGQRTPIYSIIPDCLYLDDDDDDDDDDEQPISPYECRHNI